MIKELTLPEIAENVESGVVVEIMVSEGDTIEAEQPLVELETDKATFEVPATESGVIKEIKVSKGDELKVGGIIVTIETGGDAEKEKPEKKKEAKEEIPEQIEEETNEQTKSEGAADKSREKQEQGNGKQPEKKIAIPEKQQKPEPVQEEKKYGSYEDVPAAPSVRRLAHELNIDIRQVSGTGPGGRITKEDVENFGKKPTSTASERTGEKDEKLPDFSSWGSTEKEPMSNIRRITAENMLLAWQTIPHVTHFDQADIAMAESFIEKYASKAEKEGGKLTITSILLKICATALRLFPKFNASIDYNEKAVIFKNYINIGIAVDTPRGLLVPVIKDADKKSVFRLSSEASEMAARTREKKIKPEELQGGNFTISNLGGIGGTNFTPIVYPSQIAVLGVSRASMQPVYVAESSKFMPQKIVPLSLSYDHRAIDGAEAARFLRWICTALEDPFAALMEGGI